MFAIIHRFRSRQRSSPPFPNLISKPKVSSSSLELKSQRQLGLRNTAVTVVVGAGLKPAPTEIVGIDKSWSYRKSMKSAVSVRVKLKP